MNVTIRKGSINDLPSAYNLIKELASFENSEAEVILSAEQFYIDGAAVKKPFDFFLAEYDQNIVGLALFFDYYSTWKGRSIYLEDLIVTNKFRKKGIGKLLLKAIADYAVENNYQNVFWQVLNWNKDAIGFYKSIGSTVDNSWSNCRWTRQNMSSFLAEN